MTETTVTDENGNAVLTYKDYNKRLVCKKVQSGAGTYLVTDYIYDDFGNLRYVVPPLPTVSVINSVTNAAVAVPASFTESNAVFLSYFYAYHYDDLGRVIEKKLPGQGWQYVVYNSRDQPIMSQDANQLNNGIWMVTKYDVLGRPVMTGELTTASTRTSLQTAADASIASPFESFTNVTNNYGYTHVSYPDISPGAGKKILTVNYYDSYDVIINTAVNPGSTVFTAPLVSIDSLDKAPRGLPVATLVNVLGTTNYLFTVTHYDKYGNPVKVTSQHYQGGTLAYNKYDIEENSFSFQNVATKKIRRHYLPSSSNPLLTIITSPVYDHMNRILLNRQQYKSTTDTGSMVTLAKSDYNEVGQLITKHLHSTAAGIPASSGFLQHVDYRYNARGWLTRINNSASTTDETFTSQLDLFGENLDFDQVTNGLGGTAQYNGNISNIKWQTKVPSSLAGIITQEYKGYVFTYDPLNRLSNAAYKAQTTANNSSYDETIQYDELGNILSMVRKNGAASTLNNMTYSYMNAGIRSNKLWQVTDGGTEGFNPTYNYDNNGNLMSDAKKTVTAIAYNELNLPTQVTITTGTKVLKNVYDATGRKLERLVTTGSTTSEDRYYDDGIEYTSNTIEFVQTPEGRTLPSTGKYIYEYNITDHLGNIRVMFGDKNNDGILTANEVTQTTDYYAFGREITYSQGITAIPDNTYKYNGKELQKDIALYDYGARFYDPVIGRFTTVDPLAEQMRRHSPYNYGFDNPIRFIDKDGMG
ncbi:RHS repeat-associated core domain-containing protein, partial [Mucilaginibacter sp.]|uniref:RHS repeat domain-containing protein n=1 Tax=Mucilaginibacter sp. TaxID=1882438 RepID=UPI0025EF311C